MNLTNKQTNDEQKIVHALFVSKKRISSGETKISRKKDKLLRAIGAMFTTLPQIK